MRIELLQELNREHAARRPAIVMTDLVDGSARLVRPGDTMDDPTLAEEIARRFRSGRSGRVETAGGGEAFLAVHLPPPRLVMIGAVHISQALAPMARLAGFDVTVIDPRTAFATAERFAGTRLIPEWPQDALPRIKLDSYTALAALTHDPKIDDPALLDAFAAGCFYIGALGSRKTHARRVDRLKAEGITEPDLARIEAPIGLDIAAESPAEIAVAVLASVVKALRSREVAS